MSVFREREGLCIDREPFSIARVFFLQDVFLETGTVSVLPSLRLYIAMLTKIANLKLAATNAAFWQSKWSGTLVIECCLNLCVLIDVSDLEVFEEIWSFNKWSHSWQLHSVSCSWLAVSKTGWCPAIQFESGECTLGNPGGNTSILSEEAVEAIKTMIFDYKLHWQAGFDIS